MAGGKRQSGVRLPAGANIKANTFAADHAAIWRRVQKAHERRAADFARRFAHHRGGP